MKRLRVRPRAAADLDGIWLHIAREDIAAADLLIDHFTEIFRLLVRNPHMGAATPELADGLRRFPVRDYVVFYTVGTRAVVVERVLHGARDIETLFG